MKAQQAFDEAYALSKSYTEESLEGAGALKGKDGESAYQIAVDNGFVGSQADWLESLQGEDGSDGTDGFSPIITENPNNDNKTYKLDITDITGTRTTPNLKGKDGSGSGGTDDYDDLENLPSINGVELKGNKTLGELGIQPQGDYLTEIPENYVTNEKMEEYAQPKGEYATIEQVNAKISSVYKPGGSVEFKNLTEPNKDSLGFVYNITDEFTTDDRFIEGEGNNYPAGTNVVVIDDGSENYKYDVLSGFIDLTDYVTDDRTIAEFDLKDNITADELKTALGINNLSEVAYSGKYEDLEGKLIPDNETITVDEDGTIHAAGGGDTTDCIKSVDKVYKNVFTGTKTEVDKAITDGTIKDGMIVNITDDYDQPQYLSIDDVITQDIDTSNLFK